MSEECNHDCEHCADNPDNCGESGDFSSFRAEANPGSEVKKVIGIVSGKGGVGKSLVTSLLAVAANRRNKKAGILDADITGPSIPRMFGITEKAKGTEAAILPVFSHDGVAVMSVNLVLENEEDPVIWRGPMIAGAVKQFWTDVAWGDLDYLFVDMPPGTGDVPLTVFQSLPLDGIIVVTSPQDLVSMVVEKAVRMAEKMNVPVLGVVENMSYIKCPNCGEKVYAFGKGKTESIAKKHGIAKTAELPILPELAQFCDDGAIEKTDGFLLEPIAKLLPTED
jgi:Mrp family chromosome partitioning ATPase